MLNVLLAELGGFIGLALIVRTPTNRLLTHY
jgi:hypothetical protein